MLKNLFLPSPSIEERKSLNNTGLLQVFICYVLYMLAMGVGFYLVEIIILRSAPGYTPGISTVLVSYTLAVFFSLSYVFTLGRRTAKSFGMHKEDFGKKYGFGVLLSVGCLALVLLPNVLLGTVKLSLNPRMQPLSLLFLLIGFIFQGFMEEFLLRGLIFIEIAKKYGVFWGIIGNSVLFAAGHLGNSDASFISTLNTFLISLVFSFLFYYYDSMWLVSGFHSGWNFLMGPVLGIFVSGFALPTSVFTAVLPPEHAVLNGGGYGLEGSWLLAPILLVWVGILWYKSLKKSWEG